MSKLSNSLGYSPSTLLVNVKLGSIYGEIPVYEKKINHKSDVVSATLNLKHDKSYNMSMLSNI